jgi:predicted esterase
MGTTESVRRPTGIADKLWAVIDSAVAEYRGDSLAPNLLGIPFMARTGAMDRVIDPQSTRRMASLLQAAGIVWTEKKSRQGLKLEAIDQDVDATVVILAGKEHWWW